MLYRGLHTIYITIWSVSDRRKVQPPANFSQYIIQTLVSDMVNIDCLYELTNVIFNGTVVDRLRTSVSPK